MWPFFLIAFFGFIAQKPVGHYLALNIKSFGFTNFQTTLLIIPTCALQIIGEIALGWSSDRHKERAVHALIGETWSLPLLGALLEMPGHGKKWSRYILNTLIGGCKMRDPGLACHLLILPADPCFQPVLQAWISENAFDVKKRSIAVATAHFVTLSGAAISSRTSNWHYPSR